MMQPPYGLEDAFRGWTQPACGATTCSGITVTLLRLVAEEHADEVGETDIGDFGMRLGASVRRTTPLAPRGTRHRPPRRHRPPARPRPQHPRDRGPLHPSGRVAPRRRAYRMYAPRLCIYNQIYRLQYFPG
jgi:hypothetical protein